MRTYLLPENGTDYKANLHCHTTISDGAKTPEQVKQVYRDMGYSIIAFTDHDILLDHSDLNDADFLALNGFEIEVVEEVPTRNGWQKCFHVCLIAKDPSNLLQPCYHRTAYLFGGAPALRHLIQYDESKPDFVRHYTPECFREIAEEAKKGGFFLTYNHPTWSLEDYADYTRYEGMDAMEIFNGGCIVEGFDDTNPRVYDDLLRTGHRILALGTDDNHNSNPERGPHCDAGVAWTMIRAESLSYPDIIRALEVGACYASRGPEIYSLYTEDGFVHITCSEATQIRFTTGVRAAKMAASPDGTPITSASFPLPKSAEYFRVEVVDKNGMSAFTNAYFLDTLS